MIDFDEFFLIAGPCVIESYEHLYGVAAHIDQITKKMGVTWVLKASFDKANRTSMNSFRGPGLNKGMSILCRVKKELGCLITTDFHSVEQLRSHGTLVDIVQIPAFLSRQTDMLLAAAGTQKPVNVKKGQFIAPQDIKWIKEKLWEASCQDVLITERGTQFGPNNVVVDFRYMTMSRILDVTHTANKWTDSYPLARAARGLKAAIFCEVGSNMCDADKSIPLDEFEGFLEAIL